MSSTPSTDWSFLCAWQAAVWQEGSLRTTSIEASSRLPSGEVNIRQRSLLGTCPGGFSLWWQSRQPSALRSTVSPRSGP